MTTSPVAPINIGEKPFPKITGTAGNSTAARRSPFPPPLRGGTGREPGIWLVDKIATNRRAAKPKPCPRCGADTLVGDDHDVMSVTVRVDTQPVTRLEEVAAILTTGRRSYDLMGGALYYRETWHTESTRPARFPIHLEHHCEKGTLW